LHSCTFVPHIVAGRLHHHQLDPTRGQPRQQPTHLCWCRPEPFGLQRPRTLPLRVRHPYTGQQKPLPQIQPSRPQVENFVDDILASHARPFTDRAPERVSPEESRKRKKLTRVLPAATTPPWQQTVVLESTPIANLTYELTGITDRPAYQTDPTPFSGNRGGQQSGPDTFLEFDRGWCVDLAHESVTFVGGWV
jgi:hypothetical protein